MRTDEEIQAVITKLEARLTESEMSNGKNNAIKSGYEKCIELLNRSETEYNGISGLLYPQSKSIAVLCCDFIKGFENHQAFSDIPLKK